jgi:16S rRNA (guanine527-N7)-methyltransferase
MTRNKPRSVDEDDKWLEKLTCGARAMSLSVNTKALERFKAYAVMLQEWGRRINLTSKLDANEIISLHFLDSLSLLAVRPPVPGSRLVDIGSGAGFPGLPLKIARPDLWVTLVEPRQKRAAFLREAIHRLELDGIIVKQMRAGEQADDNDTPDHDLSVCRALAHASHLLMMGRALVRTGGILAAYKGPGEGMGMRQLQEEGWIFEEESPVDIPGKDTPRSILLFRRQ